eukprot:SAG11_NODE_282_length_11247_cov_11.050323_2_plen_89_part_00
MGLSPRMATSGVRFVDGANTNSGLHLHEGAAAAARCRIATGEGFGDVGRDAATQALSHVWQIHPEKKVLVIHETCSVVNVHRQHAGMC